MSYQSGDRLKNRYLSNDAFTSLKNKLGGRSITSLGNNRRQKSYKVASQGFDMLDYKSVIYRFFVCLFLLIIIAYIVPQTRYFIHGFAAKKFQSADNVTAAAERKMDADSTYNVAPVFLKTDEFIAKQKTPEAPEGAYVADYFSGDIVGTTVQNSSSTVNIKLFSDAGFRNNFLIEQDADVVPQNVSRATTTTGTSTLADNASTTATTTDIAPVDVIQEANHTYQSYVFEGLGYGQLIAKVPPQTQVTKDSSVYIRTEDGLKPIAKIVKVDEDNKSTFTIIYAQLMVAPQNIYNVTIK